MKKKLWFVLVVVLLVVSLAGCGGGGKSEEDTVFIRGVWADGVYTNETLKLSFTLSEGWEIMSDEVWSGIAGLSPGDMGEPGAPLNETMSNVQQFVEMWAVDSLNISSVSIEIANIGKFGMSEVSETDYLDIRKKEWASEGYIFSDIRKEIVAGQDYFTMEIEVDDASVEPRRKMFLKNIDGDYMVTILIIVYDDTDFDEIMSYFSALE